MSRLPRWAHRIYAWLGGYFWLPCPVCGEHFSGHEIGRAVGATEHLDSIPLFPSMRRESPGRAICPTCIRRGMGCLAWWPRLIHPDCQFAPPKDPS